MSDDVSADIAVYKVDALMAQTRQLAAEYRRTTGQSLPVTSELARYDGMRLLELSEPQTAQAGIDAIGEIAGKTVAVQIKGRMLVEDSRGRERVGQLNMEGGWDVTLLVLFNPSYETQEIILLGRETIEQALAQAKNKHFTVAKFKAIGQSVWVDDK